MPNSFLLNTPKWMFELDLKITEGKNENVIDYMEKSWFELVPNLPFKYKTLNQALEELYIYEIRLRKMITIFGVLAVVLASMGLFGMSVLTAKSRIKVIGIYKVYGASVRAILVKTIKDYVWMTLLAILISSVASYFIMTKWLENFAFRITIQPWIFVLAGSVSFLIVFSTLIYKSLKAANSNPVDSLKYE